MNTSSKPASILLIDDDTDTQQIVSLIISHFHYSLTIVSTAKAALLELSKMSPDIVMLDIKLPDANGYTVLNDIRSAKVDHQPKVVAITAYYTKDSNVNMIDYGFDGYLPKPITAATLIPYLQRLVAPNGSL